MRAYVSYRVAGTVLRSGSILQAMPSSTAMIDPSNARLVVRQLARSEPIHLVQCWHYITLSLSVPYDRLFDETKRVPEKPYAQA